MQSQRPALVSSAASFFASSAPPPQPPPQGAATPFDTPSTPAFAQSAVFDEAPATAPRPGGAPGTPGTDSLNLRDLLFGSTAGQEEAGAPGASKVPAWLADGSNGGGLSAPHGDTSGLDSSRSSARSDDRDDAAAQVGAGGAGSTPLRRRPGPFDA